jgi:hypothetical protein
MKVKRLFLLMIYRIIRNAIDSLNRALIALHNEEVIEMMKELGVEGVK